jgi:hypothetical protein
LGCVQDWGAPAHALRLKSTCEQPRYHHAQSQSWSRLSLVSAHLSRDHPADTISESNLACEGFGQSFARLAWYKVLLHTRPVYTSNLGTGQTTCTGTALQEPQLEARAITHPVCTSVPRERDRPLTRLYQSSVGSQRTNSKGATLVPCKMEHTTRSTRKEVQSFSWLLPSDRKRWQSEFPGGRGHRRTRHLDETLAVEARYLLDRRSFFIVLARQ